MRVPDITLTAGNAAHFTHINNLPEQSQSTTFTGGAGEYTIGNELNKNDNWTTRQFQTTTTGRFSFLPTGPYSNSSAYTTSADEFVQRALSSSIAVPYEYNNSTLSEAHGYGEYYQSNSQTRNYLENYGSNSNSAYKGFQEVYVNRAAIALDDYEKNNRSAKFGNNGSDYNTEEQHQQYETHSPCVSSGIRSADYQYAYNDTKIVVGDTRHELNSNHQQQFVNKVTTAEYTRDPEHDYNDHSMLELCNDTDNKSAIEQHNDELDDYLTSPTSSSISVTAPHRSYFPRGIVNPNYPGFQHLAHTLSEHFIGCTPSDSYDSDMSECEMELSGDSCDDLSNDELQSELNVKMNIYNNNSSSNDSHKRESRCASPELSINAQQNQQLQQSYKDANSNSAVNSNNETSEDQEQQQYQLQSHQQQKHSKLGALIANELHDNLRQLLTLNVPDNYTDAYIINSADNFPFRYDQKCRLVAQIDGETPQVYGTTPDILLKNCNLRPSQQSKKENRPDLLRGVSPQPLRKHVETGNEENVFVSKDSILGQQERGLKQNTLTVNEVNSRATTPVLLNDIGRDDGAGCGITPVDIIGNFEQEVEREFGLLVSGYRRLVEPNDDTNDNENAVVEPKAIEKVSDAMLSSAKDLIDSNKYVNALKQSKEVATPKVGRKTQSTINMMDFMEDNNAVDWSYGRCGDSEAIHSSQTRDRSDQKVDDITDMSTVSNTNSAQIRPKYQKPSYDERQLPPVAIEYKRCQQIVTRNPRKSPGQNNERSEKATKIAGGSKIVRNHSKTNFANRFFNSSRRSNVGSVGSRLTDKSADSNRSREEAEIHQYQELISNKEQISRNSRYAKMSGWSQHVKSTSTAKNHGGKYASKELASPSALELFDAYKLGGDCDKETLQKHLKLAKEIEKKRRSDREEIRRRLAMGVDENSQQSNDRAVWKTGIQSRVENAQLGRLNDPASDTESHSSDSETCPKLSNKSKAKTNNACALNVSLAENPTYPYAGSARAPLSSKCSKSQTNMKLQQSQQNCENTQLAISSEDMECDFFTKQAKLQIEARMALAQAKEIAHMQMEIERQNRRTSPITDIIRVSLEKVGVQMSADKRRLSRQMLTEMNVAQLQVLVNSLHTHIEDLNESLVHNLMERDDMHVTQDSMLVDIEELTRYIGANEHLARYKNHNPYNHK
ncbi:putative leucine-rich repeat-containing protein DDB_G0290503 [Eurosta solidaginis]|uniref:putative leucine-rich repeat-containing protein DDB_G0290503 n=1 Tax=Eurosta solidaginis TaxID=178769 RepID=UPI003530BDFC